MYSRDRRGRYGMAAVLQNMYMYVYVYVYIYMYIYRYIYICVCVYMTEIDVEDMPATLKSIQQLDANSDGHIDRCVCTVTLKAARDVAPTVAVSKLQVASASPNPVMLSLSW